MKRISPFHILSFMILCTFMSIMLVVVIVAHNRKSGNTGMDMSAVQKLRYEAEQKKYR